MTDLQDMMQNRRFGNVFEMKQHKMKTGTDKQLLFGHQLLHMWKKNPSETDWTKEEINSEHNRLVGIMKQRGIEHNTPM